MGKKGKDADKKDGGRSCFEKAILYLKILLCIVLLGALGYGGLYVYNNFFKDDGEDGYCFRFDLVWEGKSCTAEKWSEIIITNMSRPYTVETCAAACGNRTECGSFLLYTKDRDCLLLKSSCTQGSEDRGVSQYTKVSEPCSAGEEVPVPGTPPPSTPVPAPVCSGESSWGDTFFPSLGKSCLEYATNTSFQSKLVQNTSKDDCGCLCLTETWCNGFQLFDEDCILLQSGCTLADTTVGIDYFGKPEQCKTEDWSSIYPSYLKNGCKEYPSFLADGKKTEKMAGDAGFCGCKCKDTDWCVSFAIFPPDCYLLPEPCTPDGNPALDYYGPVVGEVTPQPTAATPQPPPETQPPSGCSEDASWASKFPLSTGYGCNEYTEFAQNPNINTTVIPSTAKTECGCACLDTPWCSSFVILNTDCYLLPAGCSLIASDNSDYYGPFKGATAEPTSAPLSCEESTWKSLFTQSLKHGCLEYDTYVANTSITTEVKMSVSEAECGCECVSLAWCKSFVSWAGDCYLIGERCTPTELDPMNYFELIKVETTEVPTVIVTGQPTVEPSISPTAVPTSVPTSTPTGNPGTAVTTAEPTVIVTSDSPSNQTIVPTAAPTDLPTSSTGAPTESPSIPETDAPPPLPCLSDSDWEPTFPSHPQHGCTEYLQYVNDPNINTTVLKDTPLTDCGCKCLESSWCVVFAVWDADCYLIGAKCTLDGNQALNYYGHVIGETDSPPSNITQPPTQPNATCPTEAYRKSFAVVPAAVCSEFSDSGFKTLELSPVPPAVQFTEASCACECSNQSWCKGYQLSVDLTLCTLFQEGCTVTAASAGSGSGSLSLWEPTLVDVCDSSVEIMTKIFTAKNSSICVQADSRTVQKGAETLKTPQQCGCECNALPWCVAFSFEWSARNCTLYSAGGCENTTVATTLSTTYIKGLPEDEGGGSSSSVGAAVAGIIATITICGCVGYGCYYLKTKRSTKRSDSVKFNFELGYDHMDDEVLTAADYTDLANDSLEELMAQDYAITCVNCYEPAPSEEGSCSRCGHSLSPERERFTFTDRASTVLRNIKSVYL
eukprot:TRINITY_DN5224_c0_g2_i1.p1 TRINITY_DN5224_c0_g2~~TRINITY_DN5224_c0_g2_i1.p1  ORF type:complete len:1059 (+),score=169.16 TRINITY_DN5224_c0_g2_i1:46-3222(+)